MMTLTFNMIMNGVRQRLAQPKVPQFGKQKQRQDAQFFERLRSKSLSQFYLAREQTEKWTRMQSSTRYGKLIDASLNQLKQPRQVSHPLTPETLKAKVFPKGWRVIDDPETVANIGQLVPRLRREQPVPEEPTGERCSDERMRAICLSSWIVQSLGARNELEGAAAVNFREQVYNYAMQELAETVGARCRETGQLIGMVFEASKAQYIALIEQQGAASAQAQREYTRSLTELHEQYQAFLLQRLVNSDQFEAEIKDCQRLVHREVVKHRLLARSLRQKDQDNEELLRELANVRALLRTLVRRGFATFEENESSTLMMMEQELGRRTRKERYAQLRKEVAQQSDSIFQELLKARPRYEEVFERPIFGQVAEFMAKPAPARRRRFSERGTQTVPPPLTCSSACNTQSRRETSLCYLLREARHSQRSIVRCYAATVGQDSRLSCKKLDISVKQQFCEGCKTKLAQEGAAKNKVEFDQVRTDPVVAPAKQTSQERSQLNKQSQQVLHSQQVKQRQHSQQRKGPLDQHPFTQTSNFKPKKAFLIQQKNYVLEVQTGANYRPDRPRFPASPQEEEDYKRLRSKTATQGPNAVHNIRLAGDEQLAGFQSSSNQNIRFEPLNDEASQGRRSKIERGKCRGSREKKQLIRRQGKDLNRDALNQALSKDMSANREEEEGRSAKQVEYDGQLQLMYEKLQGVRQFKQECSGIDQKTVVKYFQRVVQEGLALLRTADSWKVPSFRVLVLKVIRQVHGLPDVAFQRLCQMLARLPRLKTSFLNSIGVLMQKRSHDYFAGYLQLAHLFCKQRLNSPWESPLKLSYVVDKLDALRQFIQPRKFVLLIEGLRKLGARREEVKLDQVFEFVAPALTEQPVDRVTFPCPASWQSIEKVLRLLPITPHQHQRLAELFRTGCDLVWEGKTAMSRDKYASFARQAPALRPAAVYQGVRAYLLSHGGFQAVERLERLESVVQRAREGCWLVSVQDEEAERWAQF